jgi:hypothetical protein
VLGDPPAAVVQPLTVGQVPVLVQDGRQPGHLLIEGPLGHPWPGVGHPPLSALVEELVDRVRVRAAEVAQELGGEVAVSLGEENLGRGGQLVAVGGTAPGAAGLLVVADQPVVLQPAELLTDASGGELEQVGQLPSPPSQSRQHQVDVAELVP